MSSVGVLRQALVVAVWFTFNVSMSAVMKWTYLYGKVCSLNGTNCHVYKFPFMITAIHMLFSFIVCFALIRWRADTAQRTVLTWSQQLRKIVPLAVCFSVCVAAGNLSLTYIYPSFNQMLSSGAPLVTVFVAVVLTGKRYNCWTWVSICVICGGLMVCGTEEVNFDWQGATLAVLATLLRAIKSVMQEKLLDPKEKDMDSVTLLYYLAPYAGCCLVGFSLCFEGLEPLLLLLPWHDGVPVTGAARVALLLFFSGVNACFLNISGNLVTAYMGAVMLQILGNLKACISIVVSVAIFKNEVTPLQLLGVAWSLFGVWLYNAKGGDCNKATVACQPPPEKRT